METTKMIVKDGNWVEGPRGLLGIATYDPTGRKIDSVAYPLGASTGPGKEQYLYDDKGNVVEMILRSIDGSMLSKETYKYEFDQLGNWTKKSSSVAVYENGKISFEPTGTTYRTISYYYNQAIQKLNAPSTKSKEVLASRTSSTLLPTARGSSTDSPQPSAPAAQVSFSILPPEAANTRARREPVTAPVDSVAPAKSGTAATDSQVATSGEIGTTPDETPVTNVVQHVAEEVLRNAAIEFPKPEYSDVALLARASGKVKVQILVDENGHVTNAQATSGHPLLGAAAEAAARKARFSLAKVSSGATKVSGVISYDFVPPTPASEASPVSSPTTDGNPPKAEDRKPEARPIPEKPVLVESIPNASANYSEAAKSFYNKGVTFQASGRYAEAAEAFNQSIRLNPNDAIAYLKLGLAYSGLRQYKEALVGFKMAARIKREVVDAEGYYRWGYAYSTLGELSNAQDAFKQALYIARAEAADPGVEKAENSPLLEEIHYSLGFAYHKAKRYNDA
ncbi:MAG: TonB family protein, partial [Acidobacteriota bacterium]|nr:TonB family protein [Acidobacteriota bacterium]